MLHQRLRLHANDLTDHLLKLVLSTLLLIFLGPLKIEWGQAMPLTFQSLLVVLLPLLFGWRAGAGAVLLYLILGAVGLPVFAGGNAGWRHFLGDSGGFLIAFLVAANLSGYLGTMRYKLPLLAVAAILTLGQLVVLLGGLYWMEGLRQESFDYVAQLTVFMTPLMLKTAIGMLLYLILLRGTAARPKDLTN